MYGRIANTYTAKLCFCGLIILFQSLSASLAHSNSNTNAYSIECWVMIQCQQKPSVAEMIECDRRMD